MHTFSNLGEMVKKIKSKSSLGDSFVKKKSFDNIHSKYREPRKDYAYMDTKVAMGSNMDLLSGNSPQRAVSSYKILRN